MIDLSPSYLELVQQILKQFVPNAQVRVFGSRYRGTVKHYSDLDLVVVDKQQLALEVYYGLKEAFTESVLPFRVDVLDWYRISDEFKQIINQGYEIIQEAT